MRFWGTRLVSIVLAVLVCFGIQMFVFHTKNADLNLRLVTLASLYVTLAVSLNLINGITGQFSIGHAAFYQVGAYTAGYVSVTFFNRQTSEPIWLVLMMLVGAAAAAIAGFVVGLPSLRLRGDYLAIVTLGFGEIIRIIVQNTETIGKTKIGGSYGMVVTPKMSYLWISCLLAITCMAVCRNLLKTARGLPFLAVREDEVASQAMGVNVTKTKVTAFVLGSAFAGAAGAILAHFEGYINPTMFTMDVSFIILTMVVLGGTGSITGSAIAAAALYYLPEQLRNLPAISGNSLLGSVVGVFLAVYLIKRLSDHFHGELWTRVALNIGALATGLVTYVVVALATHSIAPLANAKFQAANLRMVIFAATLIVLMLIRPQGIFAHHEFSWSLIKRIFGKRAPATEVAA